jgi:hypothetical protein
MIQSLDVDHLVVVEPHADDAFLSMGQHIEDRVKAGKRTIIWTVFSATRKRAHDALAYAEAVGSEWMGTGAVEGQPLLDDHFPSAEFFGKALIVVPLGIQHPEHVQVRMACEKRYPPNQIAFYMDQPYAITQKHGEVVSELLRGKKVLSYRKPGIRKYRHIPLFSDQAKFYHYNPAEKLIQTCELVVA